MKRSRSHPIERTVSVAVLDTSAILAFLLEEKSGDDVALMLEGRAVVSAVNVQELLVKLIAKV